MQPISPPFHDAQKHSILQLAWVPKKPFLLSSLNNNGDFRIYHALTNEPYYPPSQREQHYPAFQRDPNDPFVAFSWAEFTDLLLTSSKQTDVYDSPLDVGARLPDAPFKQHQDSIRASVWGWGPNNSIIITADDSSMIYLWNAETAKLLYSYQYNDPITSIALGPKPGLFAVAGQKEVCILQAGANSTVTKIDTYRHNGSVNDIAWSSDKKNPRLASCGDDKNVIIWQVNGHSKLVYPFNTVVNALSWSPDGRRLALANEDKTVVTMDVP